MIEALSHVNDIFSGFELWKVAYWGVGVFGIVGFVALLIFAPSVLQLIVKIAVNILEELLSTRIGVAVLTALVVALGVNYMRRSMDDQAFAERTAQFEQQQKDRDDQIAQSAKAEVQQELDNQIAKNADLDKQLKDFTNAFPSPADTPLPPVITGQVPVPRSNPFLVGAAACKLRVLAGTAREADCQPPGHKGVSSARKRGAVPANKPAKRLPQAGAGSAGSPP